MSIQPEPIIVSPHRGNHSESTAQQAATKDQVSKQTHPLRPGETRVYPSMLADKQVPVLNLTESTITSQADLQTFTFVLYETRRIITWQRRIQRR